MKKYCILLIFIIQNIVVQAQIGSSCANADPISFLPFSKTGLVTAANLYNVPSGNNCMTGNDYVFSITPTVDKKINVTLTGTNQGGSLYVFNVCPDVANAHIIASEGCNGANPSVANVQLHADSTYYIIVSSVYFASTNFNITVEELFARDECILHQVSPVTHCGLTTNEELAINYKNYGTDTIKNPTVAFRLNDGPPIIETMNRNIPPNQGTYYTFVNELDLSIVGSTNKIVCYIIDTLDLNHSNDTLKFSATNCLVVSSFPYYEDFETGEGNWVPEWKDYRFPFSTWEHGTPNDTALNHAASGTKAWKTNLSGFHHVQEYSYITGPCFDFSTLTAPWIEFNIWYKLNSAALAAVQASKDGGATWTTIGHANEGTNWYNIPQATSGWQGSSGSWLNAKHALEGLDSLPQVQLRFVINAAVSAGANEGLAIDDIKIYEAPLKNLGVVAISAPASNCGLTSTENITIRIANFGLGTQKNFSVRYSLNNGTWINEIISDSINPGDTLNYTFIQTANLSATGNHQIDARTFLINDLDTNNDTHVENVFNFQNHASFPYGQDFESNDGGWAASGLNSSWEYGILTDTVITHAASGAKAWKTNIDGACNEGESSNLTGPCFDLTGMINPYVKFNVWYETFLGLYNGIMFKFILNPDEAWGNLGAAADPHWYNQGYNFIGSSGSWIPVWHSLRNQIGQTHIQFRFEFQSVMKLSGFAFDDFTICDAPIAQFSHTTNWPAAAFTCNSSGATTWHWNFGNGDTSIVQNPTYTFINDTNIVTLIVGNDCNTDTIVKTIIHCAPIATFTYTTNWPQVAFNCPSTVATTWNWSFGDGGTSFIKNPVHTFLHDTNTVMLIVGNNCGTDTIFQTIIHCTPVANFTYTVNWPQISFHNSTTNAISNIWSFGDGDSSLLTSPIHTFSSDSNYVTLISTNSCGSDTVTHLVTKTGVDEILLQQIKIYPNPAHKELCIDLPFVAKNATLILTDSQGKIILTKILPSAQTQSKLDVSGITKGIYQLQIRTDKYLLNKKISIQ